VTTSGKRFVVVWQRLNGAQMDIYGARLSAGGYPLDKNPIQFTTSGSSQWAPAAACDSLGCLVAWEHSWTNGGDVRGTIFFP